MYLQRQAGGNVTSVLVAILARTQPCNDIMRLWKRSGVSDVIAFESRGIHHLVQVGILQDDLPFIVSADKLRARDEVYQAVIGVAADGVDATKVIEASEAMLTGSKDSMEGVLFAMPVITLRRLNRVRRSPAV
jgi:hypothetical protein